MGVAAIIPDPRTSVNQVPDAAVSLMTGGPGDSVVSSALLGSAATL